MRSRSLLDFGLVKLGDGDDQRLERTRDRARSWERPRTCRPSSASGRAVDTRSDNYSFGVMAFEMLTGRVPFIEDTAMALIVAHMQAPPSPPSSIAPGIPPELDRMVYALLSKDPAQRPTLQQAMRTLAYFRDPGHSSGMTTGPHMPPPTMMARGTYSREPGMVSTMGQSHRQLLTSRREPGGKKRGLVYALVGLAVAAVVGVGVVVAVAARRRLEGSGFRIRVADRADASGDRCCGGDAARDAGCERGGGRAGGCRR